MWLTYCKQDCSFGITENYRIIKNIDWNVCCPIHNNKSRSSCWYCGAYICCSGEFMYSRGVDSCDTCEARYICIFELKK